MLDPLMVRVKHFGNGVGGRRFSEYLRALFGLLPKTPLRDFFMTKVNTSAPSSKSSETELLFESTSLKA